MRWHVRRTGVGRAGTPDHSFPAIALVVSGPGPPAERPPPSDGQTGASGWEKRARSRPAWSASKLAGLDPTGTTTTATPVDKSNPAARLGLGRVLEPLTQAPG